MTKTIKCKSGNEYIVESPPYRVLLDLIRWTGIAHDKEETSEMRAMAVFRIGELEDEIVEKCLSDEQKGMLDKRPTDCAEIARELASSSIDKKK